MQSRDSNGSNNNNDKWTRSGRTSSNSDAATPPLLLRQSSRGAAKATERKNALASLGQSTKDLTNPQSATSIASLPKLNKGSSSHKASEAESFMATTGKTIVGHIANFYAGKDFIDANRTVQNDERLYLVYNSNAKSIAAHKGEIEKALSTNSAISGSDAPTEGIFDAAVTAMFPAVERRLMQQLRQNHGLQKGPVSQQVASIQALEGTQPEYYNLVQHLPLVRALQQMDQKDPYFSNPDIRAGRKILNAAITEEIGQKFLSTSIDTLTTLFTTQTRGQSFDVFNPERASRVNNYTNVVGVLYDKLLGNKDEESKNFVSYNANPPQGAVSIGTDLERSLASIKGALNQKTGENKPIIGEVFNLMTDQFPELLAMLALTNSSAANQEYKPFAEQGAYILKQDPAYAQRLKSSYQSAFGFQATLGDMLQQKESIDAELVTYLQTSTIEVLTNTIAFRETSQTLCPSAMNNLRLDFSKQRLATVQTLDAAQLARQDMSTLPDYFNKVDAKYGELSPAVSPRSPRKTSPVEPLKVSRLSGSDHDDSSAEESVAPAEKSVAPEAKTRAAQLVSQQRNRSHSDSDLSYGDVERRTNQALGMPREMWSHKDSSEDAAPATAAPARPVIGINTQRLQQQGNAPIVATGRGRGKNTPPDKAIPQLPNGSKWN